ncbi:unnamed protein product [Lota lota]
MNPPSRHAGRKSSPQSVRFGVLSQNSLRYKVPGWRFGEWQFETCDGTEFIQVTLVQSWKATPCFHWGCRVKRKNPNPGTDLVLLPGSASPGSTYSIYTES